MIKYTLATALTIGLAACGGGGSDNSGGSGGGGNNNITKYNGTWKSEPCETIGSRSYKQTWTINGTNLNNDLEVWSNNGCSGAPKNANIKATLEYKNEIDVANFCSSGKAQEVDVTYTSLKIGNIPAITGEQKIQNLLATLNIDKALPKYGLICIGNDGNLYHGLITDAKDASSEEKRPDEIDTTDPLILQQ